MKGSTHGAGWNSDMATAPQLMPRLNSDRGCFPALTSPQYAIGSSQRFFPGIMLLHDSNFPDFRFSPSAVRQSVD